jgi:RNA polymerase sigma-70 factor (ECF subfamily)
MQEIEVLPVTMASEGTSPESALAALFRDLAADRKEALAGLWDACSAELYGLALWRTGSAADAADVVQEVFVKLASRRRSLGGVRNPRGYLLTMTHRGAIDRMRRRRPHEELRDDLLASPRDPVCEIDAARLSGFLHQLPAKQREVVYLHHYAELSFAAIARVTGSNRFTAASRYRLALARLRQLMGIES